jgi:eukaryotic-like serine/threonine-protein kinase
MSSQEPPTNPAKSVWTAPVYGDVVFGKYIFREFIAEGGMALIASAHHAALGEPVAIKILRPQFLQDVAFLSYFAREAKATARVRSDYAVRVHDVGFETMYGPYIVMEQLEGRSLSDRIFADGAVDVATACEFAIQVCDALAAAHLNGIVHRDIKPDNIFLVNRTGLEACRVIDFGISKSVYLSELPAKREASGIRTSTLAGSPAYMAPEQMRRVGELDGRADIWSLGVTLFEMLAGCLPFPGDSVAEICRSVLERNLRDLRILAPEVPEPLVQTVLRCLEENPEDRYAHVGDLVADLLPLAHRRARGVAEQVAARFEGAGTPIGKILLTAPRIARCAHG